MNTLSKTVLALAALAASCAGGYWYGKTSLAATASSAAPVAAKSSSGASLASTAAGSGVNVTDLLNGATGAQAAALLEKWAKTDPALLAAWAKTLSPDKCSAVLASLKALPANAQLSSVIGAVVNSWATQDPKNFLSASGDVAVPRVREDGVDTALKAWAASDPKAALDWFKQNPGTASTKSLQSRYAAAIAGYAAADPEGALATVSSLGEDSQRDRQMKSSAMKAYVDALSDQDTPGQFVDTLSALSKLAPGQVHDDAMSELAQRWAQSNPQEASASVASLTDPQLRATMGLQVAKAWVADDPAAAAAWAAQMDQQNAAGGNTTPGQNNPQLLAATIRDWANYDLDSPGTFLNSLPASSNKDSAVAIFSLRAAQEDPQSAVQWVGTITNPDTRSRVTMGVAFQMLQQDPAQFNTFVANTTLLNDQQKQMLQNIPPDAVQNMNRMNSMMGGGDAMQNMMENFMINGGGPFGGGRGRGGFGGPPPGGGGGQGGGGPGGG